MNFLSFSRNYEKKVSCLQIRGIKSPNFAVNRRIIWISNKICQEGAKEYSDFFNKKIFLKMKYINRSYFLILRLKFLKVEMFRKKIYCENVFWKEIEMKMPKFRNISISQISTTPDRNYERIVITYIIIRYLYPLNVKLFTNEVYLLRKLVS
jgi:hypothetical protein